MTIQLERINDFKFLRDWKEYQINVLKGLYPKLTEDELDNVLNILIRKKLVNPDAVLDNNYEGKNIKTDLLSVVDWIDNVQPICGGFACFYKNQYKEVNPAATMIDKFLKSRKYFKNQLPNHTKGSERYIELDRLQLTEKINVNSYYGVNGCSTSQFFSIYTATSVTSAGQSLIATTNSSFEYFMANNNPFFDLDECINYLTKIKEKENKLEWKVYLNEVDNDKLFNYLKSLFLEWKEEYSFILYSYIGSMSKEEVTRAYYINNLYEFCNLKEVNKILMFILNNVDSFKDPNKPPKQIKDQMDRLWVLFEEFVVYESFAYERITRLKTMERKSVTTIDTDSNMVCVDPFVTMMKSLTKDERYNNDIPVDELVFASVNTLAFLLTKFMGKILGIYTEKANIPEEFRGLINMKNEFLFSIQVLANVKKRYITDVLLREGDYIGGDLDIKGHDFVKSATSDELKEKFVDMVKRHIVYTDEINIKGILNDVRNLEEDIKNSLLSGDMKYYSNASVKELAAYKNPLSIQGVRGVLAWNTSYPDQAVQLPDKVGLVKVKLQRPEFIEHLKDNEPGVYERLMKEIYENPDEKIRKKGIYVMGIPYGTDIPEWILNAIDTDEMINGILKKFYPVLHSLGIKIFKSSKKDHYSNIIDL